MSPIRYVSFESKIKNIDGSKNSKSINIGYLNINSIRNKLTGLNSIVGDKFEILGIAETKLDSSFPQSQFLRKGFKKPYRLDISDRSGGLLVYVKEGISSRYLKDFSLPPDIQFIPIELRLKSYKWLVVFIYRPPSQNLDYFLDNISNLLDFYSNIERCILIGDFNCDPKDPILDNFLQCNLLHCHINCKTCFKSAEGSCIDLILSNQKHGLQKTGTFDTGLSDFHHLVYTQLKTKFTRSPPKKICFRSFGKFVENSFLNDLALEMTSSKIVNYELFQRIFVSTLDKHAPRKFKLIRGNEKPHVNRALRKAIMKRSQLRNIYRRSHKNSDLHAYRKQRNFVCSLNRKIKRTYFDSVASNQNASKQHFWNICKPFFSDKHTAPEKILLVQDDDIISSDSVTAKVFNTYFNDITKTLNLKSWESDIGIQEQLDDPVLNAISKYQNHPSIIKIKEVYGSSSTFEFTEVDTDSVHKLVMSLNSKKSTSGEISPKILKLSADICSFALKNCYNASLQSCRFPSDLKLASITPVFKVGDETKVENYRPISILPTVSKVFEKIMANQLNAFFDTRLSNLLCGFRKNHSTQHALLRLLHHWQKALDDSKIVGTVLMDLSKAYDCLPHELLIAKLAAYGIGYQSLKFIFDYLTNRKHRVKIGDKFSTFLLIILGIPQGSILGPLLFNIFINDLLLYVRESEICNFADDNSLYAVATTLAEVVGTLTTDTLDVIRWFDINGLAANPGKFQIMFLGPYGNIPDFNLGSSTIKISETVKLLGIHIDNKLQFKYHVDLKCQKASGKLKALRRIRPYLSVKTAKALCNAFILSNFNYCPLIWMRFDKASNSLLDKIHRKSLAVVYQDFNSSFTDLLKLSNSDTFHIRFIKKLLEEIFKSVNGLSPAFISELFQPKYSGYELRRGHQLVLPRTATVKYGLHSIRFVGCLIWDHLPKDVKSLDSVKSFNNRIRRLKNFCTCPICK